MKNTCVFGRIILPVLLILYAVSCSTETNIQQILGKSVEAPVFLECRPLSSTEIVFKFSVPVRVASFHSDPFLEAASITEGEEVTVTFPAPLEAGKRITVDIVVEDSGKNSLNVIVPFRARNDRMPRILLNEFRTEYSKPRVEFVELYTLSSGNLGAMRLFIASNSLTNPVYEFPPIEVGKGEYIVLHLRSLEEGCIDETGSNLELSSATDSGREARDLWIRGTSELFRKTDALLLMDQDDCIMDGALLCETPETGWGKKKEIAEAAELLSRQGVWKPDSQAAVFSKNTTPTRTICRDENSAAGGPENWYVTVDKGHTPGGKNNVKRYQ